MVDRRSLLVAAASFWLAAGVSASAHAQDAPVEAVATFSIIGDIVREVGGERVHVTTLVGPDGDAHVYEPTPADVRKLGEAAILFENGLAFEGWLTRLVEASGFKGPRVIVSEGVKPRAADDDDDHAHDQGHDHGHSHSHDHAEAGHGHADHAHAHAGHHHGSEDPHAWQNVANAVIYARNVAAALEKLDPDHASQYRDRAADYIARLEALDAKLKAQFAAIPESRRKVVTSHDAFGYFGDAYGLTFIAPEGVSTEAEASATDVARIIDQIRREDITAVFVENISSSKLIEQIASETGAKTGGKLYSDALAKPGQPASTYIGMIEWNAGEIARALAPAP
ncbi:metal ABC transporter substrate-binding protein [Pseudochelatococcus sp. B33]